MAMTNWATAKYKGLGKDGKGHVSTQSGALANQPYGFNTRFEDGDGTNPEEQIAAAHASCFAMALSFGLAEKGLTDGDIATKAVVTLEKDGDGFTITKSALSLNASIPGLSRDDFDAAANDAKKNCPISKVLSCDVTLDIEGFDG